MRIYVGNIPFNTTEDELRNAFGQYGEVQEAAMIIDRESGKPRGFAFVTMPDDRAAQDAMQALNGADFGGRRMVVSEAKERTQRTAVGRPRPAGGKRRRDEYAD